MKTFFCRNKKEPLSFTCDSWYSEKKVLTGQPLYKKDYHSFFVFQVLPKTNLQKNNFFSLYPAIFWIQDVMGDCL